eukprot:gene13850-19773_t
MADDKEVLKVVTTGLKGPTCLSIIKTLMADDKEVLKLVTTVLRILERQDLKDSVDNCYYRVSQEGLPFILPYITKQRLELSSADFLNLLKERFLMLPGAPLSDKQGPRNTVLANESTLKVLETVKAGCFIAEMVPADAAALGFSHGTHETDGALAANAPLAISAWKGRASISHMVEKAECIQMIDKIESAVARAAKEAVGAAKE